MSARFCTNCGKPHPASARFCPACGTAVAADVEARETGRSTPTRPASAHPTPSGDWQYDEFTESLRPFAGDYRYTAHVAAWQGAFGGVPDGHMREPIKRGVKALLDRVAKDGWEPREPTDPDRLWEAKRVEFDYANDLVDSLSGTSRSARLVAVNINFRRWVPAGTRLPETSGSTSARAAREERARTISQLAATVESDRRQRVMGRVKRTLWWAALAGVVGVSVAGSHLAHWREWVSPDRTAGPPGFLVLDMAANVALLIAVVFAAVAVGVANSGPTVQEQPPWARRYVGKGGALAFAAIVTLEIFFIVGPADDPFSDPVFGWGLLRFVAQCAAFVSTLYLVKRFYGRLAAALIPTAVIALFVILYLVQPLRP
jgi:hypothetical protein